MRYDADDPTAPQRHSRCITRAARAHAVPRRIRQHDKSWRIRSTAFLLPLMPTCVIGDRQLKRASVNDAYVVRERGP